MLARAIRRDEERMAKYLEGVIPTLTKAVAKAEIRAAERSSGSRRASGRRRAASAGSSSSSKARGRKTSTTRVRGR